MNTSSSLSYLPIDGTDTQITSNLYAQPLTFLNQIYPKVPWYPKSGMPCDSKDGCGAACSCSDKKCSMNIGSGTVFSSEVKYKFANKKKININIYYK